MFQNKPLKQTNITSFFPGTRNNKAIMEPNTKFKKKRVRKRTSFTAPSNLRRNFESISPYRIPQAILDKVGWCDPMYKLPVNIFSSDSDSDAQVENLSTIRRTRRRKSKTNCSVDKKPMTVISLNRPSISPPKTYSPEKSKIDWKSSTTSTPVCSSKIVLSKSKELSTFHSRQDDTTILINRSTENIMVKGEVKGIKNESPSTPKKVKILSDQIVSPSKLPAKKKSAGNSSLTQPATQSVKKEETKKINFTATKVMTDFMLNILHNKSLKFLLEESEKDIMLKFFSMDQKYQYLSLKLYTYKPIWYNIFKYVNRLNLEMTEQDVAKMYNYLQENDLVDTDYMVEDLPILLSLLDTGELRELFRSFKFPIKNKSKDLIIETLLEHCNKQATLTNVKSTEQILRERIKNYMGFCVRLNQNLRDCLYKVFVLNTFMNPNVEKLQDYLNREGFLNVTYPEYITEDFMVFYSKGEFAEYVEARKCRAEFDLALEKRKDAEMLKIATACFEKLKGLISAGNNNDSTRPPYLERFTGISQYISLLSSASKHLGSNNMETVATWLLFLLTQKNYKHKRGDWFCQLSMIQTKKKNYQGAANTVIKAFKDQAELTEVQKHELAQKAKILNRKTYKLPSLLHDQLAALLPPSCDVEVPESTADFRAIRSNEVGRKRKYIEEKHGEKTFFTVEQCAMTYYETIGYPKAKHEEGRLISCLFVLLFYDVIYGTFVKGTLINEKQNVPLDLYTMHFYDNRRAVIRKRLREIIEWTDEDFTDFITKNWNFHSHEDALLRIQTIFSDIDDILIIIKCIGREVLSKILERLVLNFKDNSSGFPDLLVYHEESLQYKFVEVKGENDKLSIKQKLWIKFLVDNGITTEVCHIHSIGSKRRVQRLK